MVVVLFLCMRTMLLLLNATDDAFRQSDARRRWNQQQDQPGRSSLFSQLLQCAANVSRPSGDQIHARNQQWQLHDTDTPRNELLIYSAFYDNRRDSGSQPVLRILGVANRHHSPFYCQIWYNGVQSPHIVPADELKNGRGDAFGKIFYGQYMYTCTLQRVPIMPTHVSMTSQKCQAPTTYLPVLQPGSAFWEEEFGICVPLSFGNLDPLELVEWFELVQLLGVSSVYVYNATLAPDVNRLFDHYRQTGLLQVFSIPPPVDEFSKRGAKLGSPASLNDCLMRNMFAHRYLIIVDFDEVIVPRANQNYTVMIENIKKRHQLRDDGMSYTFRNVYFFRDLPADISESERHRMLRFRFRVAPSRYMYAAKSFVDPRRCLSVFNHYCYIRFPSAGPHWTVDVDTAIAMSHHYRYCNFGNEKCNALYKSKITDDLMLRYKDKLHSLTEVVVRKIG